jgi:FixJ family two-component response regulator
MTQEHLIAIVDDDESVREAALSLFRSMGFQAVAFPSAEDFLASEAIGRTSCLVLDVQMPGMGGLQLQSRLAADGRNIPIVFITAYPEDSVRAKALGSGALVFLTKPFSEGELLEGLRSALEPGEGRKA